MDIWRRECAVRMEHVGMNGCSWVSLAFDDMKFEKAYSSFVLWDVQGESIHTRAIVYSFYIRPIPAHREGVLWWCSRSARLPRLHAKPQDRLKFVVLEDAANASRRVSSSA